MDGEPEQFTELESFLASRLEGGSRWVGRSSNAMVREALRQGDVSLGEYPRDHADLSRCCMTYALAPWSLKALMLPRLTLYCEYAMNGFRRSEPSPLPRKRRYRVPKRILRWLP